MNPRLRHHVTDVPVRHVLPQLRMRRLSPLGDDSRASSGIPTKRCSLRRRSMYLCQMFWESLVRDSQNPRHRYWSSDFSGSAASCRSFHSRERQRLCARACARARKDARLIFKPNGPPFITRQDLILIRIKSFLPLQVVPHDTLLICPAVTNETPPLRGGVSFARQDRIVAQQKLRYPYQDISAGNCARGAQQQSRPCRPALHDPQL